MRANVKMTVHDADHELANNIVEELHRFNQSVLGPYDWEPFQVAVRNDSGELIGGMNGGVHLHWLYIDTLWIREDARGRSLGKALLEEAEREGRRRGAKRAHLDSMEFQAVGFYEKAGYREFGRIKNFAGSFDRVFLAKDPL